jgi:hypothetical protein
VVRRSISAAAITSESGGREASISPNRNSGGDASQALVRFGDYKIKSSQHVSRKVYHFRQFRPARDSAGNSLAVVRQNYVQPEIVDLASLWPQRGIHLRHHFFRIGGCGLPLALQRDANVSRNLDRVGGAAARKRGILAMPLLPLDQILHGCGQNLAVYQTDFHSNVKGLMAYACNKLTVPLGHRNPVSRWARKQIPHPRRRER